MSELVPASRIASDRWLTEAEAAQHCNLSRNSFRRHVLPLLTPARLTKRLIRYDREEIDRRLGDAKPAPSEAGEEAAWLAKLDGDTSARR